MPYQIDVSPSSDPDELSRLEWIETNGTGGWASSTISGINTRRYHGLLVASDPKDPRRISQVARMEETLLVNPDRFELGAADYGGVIHPRGFQYLTRFTKDLFPQYQYSAGGIILKKTVAAIYGENTTLVHYEVVQAPPGSVLRLNPFISCRDYHSLVKSNNAIRRESGFEMDTWHAEPYDQMPGIFIHAPGFSFTSQPNWFYNNHYRIEQFRGLDSYEDLFSYGYLEKPVRKADEVFITLSSGTPSTRDGKALLAKETKRRQELIRGNHHDSEKILRLAADQLIIQSPAMGWSIIAGYHWFTPWARDTMISISGLCLACGRLDEAKKILQEFIPYIHQGLLPNRFPDHGQKPDYNTVDATLWFFQACFGYLEARPDDQFLRTELIPAFKTIMDWHERGTLYNIHVDGDGLLYSGEPGVQLTWMDAKVANTVITARTGKPVEISALWYNALMIYSHFLKSTGDTVQSVNFQLKAAVARDRFRDLYWNEDKKCLFDVINGDQKDASLRPNQLLAISLPFPLIEGDKAKMILEQVRDKLYTPRGLRSLSPDDQAYQGTYSGDQDQRDRAYHQGTVWPWLLGPYIDAIMKVYGRRGRTMAMAVFEEFRPHFSEAGIGTVSEIFDGAPPHSPRGCIAQAWSVGELIRVYFAYKLYTQPSARRKKQTA